MDGSLRFTFFVGIALVVFVAILHFVLRRRGSRPRRLRLLAVAAVVVVGGMVFAKVGQNSGLPWWIYYTLPALVTIAVPPVVFRMSRRETVAYLVLAFLSSPAIHLVFSFFLGWKDYMPFVEIPAMWELW